MKAKHVIGIALSLLALSACSLTSMFFGTSIPKSTLIGVQVIAEAKANQNSATAIDLVFVYEPSAVDLLPKTGPAWFEAKEDLLSAFPQGIDVVSLQIPPLFMTRAKLPKRSNEAVRVIAYANYLTEAGQRPINLTTFKMAVIRLKPAAIDARGV